MPSSWLRRWRDEYYTENPVVWLLAKTESELCLRQISAPEPAEAGSASSRLQLLKSDSRLFGSVFPLGGRARV
jgi:hypothetical protein